jgi:hypothetical protein
MKEGRTGVFFLSWPFIFRDFAADYTLWFRSPFNMKVLFSHFAGKVLRNKDSQMTPKGYASLESGISAKDHYGLPIIRHFCCPHATYFRTAGDP